MSRRETPVKVVMRKGNASGRRAGTVLTLDAPTAKAWLERGWCDVAPDGAASGRPVETAAPAATRE